MVLQDCPVIPYIYLPIRTAKILVSNIRNIQYPQDPISARPARYPPTAFTFLFFSSSLFLLFLLSLFLLDRIEREAIVYRRKSQLLRICYEQREQYDLVSFFRVAPVLKDIRLTYYVYRARDLRETRTCIIDTALENKNNNHLPTNTAYVSQYSDIRAR